MLDLEALKARYPDAIPRADFQGMRLGKMQELFGNIPEQDAARRRADMTRRLVMDPVLSEALQRFRSGEGSIRTAMDVVGESGALALSILISSSDDEWPQGISDMRAVMVATNILAAAPFLWLDEVRLAIPPADGHTLNPDSMPFEHMWWTFENDIGSLPGGPYGSSVDWTGMTLQSYKDEVHICAIGMDGRGRLQVQCGTPNGDSMHAELAGMAAFLTSPHIGVDELRIDRGARRRLERASGRRVDPIVRCITLGRNQRRSGGAASGDGTRDHTHRWMVRGHYRNQWFPSKEKHQLRFIAPHIKGPEGAPLKPTVYKVAK